MYLGPCTRVHVYTIVYMSTSGTWHSTHRILAEGSCRILMAVPPPPNDLRSQPCAEAGPPKRQSCEEARRRKKGRHPHKPGGLRRDGNHSGVEPLSPIWLMDRFMSPGIYTDLSAPARRARSFKASLNWRTRQRGHDVHAATDVSMQRANRGWNFPSPRFWIAWESVLRN